MNKKNKKGSILIFGLALCSFLIIAMTISMEIGLVYLNKISLKNTTDAAVLSGTSYGKEAKRIYTYNSDGSLLSTIKQVKIDSEKANSKSTEVFNANTKYNSLANNTIDRTIIQNDNDKREISTMEIQSHSKSKTFWGRLTNVFGKNKINVVTKSEVKLEDAE